MVVPREIARQLGGAERIAAAGDFHQVETLHVTGAVSRSAGGVRVPTRQNATMPSPPIAPGTVWDPSPVSEPSALTLNSSTMPLTPVWT